RRGSTTVTVSTQRRPHGIANRVLGFLVAGFDARTAEGALRSELEALDAACRRERYAPTGTTPAGPAWFTATATPPRARQRPARYTTTARRGPDRHARCAAAAGQTPAYPAIETGAPGRPGRLRRCGVAENAGDGDRRRTRGRAHRRRAGRRAHPRRAD